MKVTEDKWKTIVDFYSESKLIPMVGSCSNSGQPNVTPIGTLTLRDDGTGYYFDLFTKELSANLDQNNNICVSINRTGGWFWFKSLRANKYGKIPGVKLIGRAGERRRASEEEIKLMKNKLKSLQKLKGYNTIFGDLSYVRDITFTDYFTINTGKMTYKI